MYTIVSAVLRQQRKSDVMTYFGLTARSAIYYEADSPLQMKSWFVSLSPDCENGKSPWGNVSL
jgi:hypothetical protein